MIKKAIIIGAGLAGSEAAWQLLKRGVSVEMIEMRPQKQTPAHRTGLFGELVCSNSLRSDDSSQNAVGLLHAELRALDSLIMRAADRTKVPAGGALAVNRGEFAAFITDTLKNHPLFSLTTAESGLPKESSVPVIVATGPLTSDKMAADIQALTKTESLHFFDAVAPVFHTDSLDLSKAWYQSRYDKGDKFDYLNCPLSKEEYDVFLKALLNAEKVEFKEWEKNTPYFEGCLPVEVMAGRGRETLLFGPMKPVGLSDPNNGGRRPFAVMQLRKENKAGTLMNAVGFQTKLTYPAQKQVFQLIPALKNAEFARFGSIHRNTFVCGPKVLTEKLSLKARPEIKLAGQLTGCEGYVESTAVGALAALFTLNGTLPPPPAETALGAMLRHITEAEQNTLYQPMNMNFGLLPPLAKSEGSENRRSPRGKEKKLCLTDRAKQALKNWLLLLPPNSGPCPSV